MIFKQLVYLTTLARERHFGRAAAACHVSQPTLSAAIKQLEDELGIPIVERGHKFIGLTAEGQCVLDHAQRILAETEAMKQNLQEMGQGLSGRLRLGAIPTALPVIAHITAPFYQRFPQVIVTVMSMNSEEINRGVESFDLDVGLTYLDNEPLHQVQAKPIYDEDYVFLTPIDGPYAKRDEIGWAEAADAHLCLLTPDMQNRRIVDGVFRSVGKQPVPAMETNSIFNLCSHTSAGHWSSIVPRPLLEFFGLPQNTKPLQLVHPDVRKSVGLIIANRQPVPPIARNLIALSQPLDVRKLIVPPARLPL